MRALGRAVRRDLGTFQSIKVNNFFLFVALLVWAALQSGLEPKSAEPFIALMVFLLLFPLSADPFARIPAYRLASWPLGTAQRFGLRLASVLLSPVLWLAGLILFTTARPATALFFIAVAIGIQAVTVLGKQVVKRAPHWNLLRHIPQLPGPLGGLIRKNTREMLSVLDTYLAIILSIAGSAYRFLSPHADPAAFPILALLIAVALSTYAQCLFGLDVLSAGMTRYGLLPLRGWAVLLSKDIAYLGILLVLVLPLNPGAGLTFGMTALAIGRYPSVYLHAPQRRWRFTGGRVFPGVVQGIAGGALGFGESQQGVLFLAAAAAWLVSLYLFGNSLDRQLSSQTPNEARPPH